ncbi:hypothetical protein ACQ4M3_09495 [Leptolyngbya sp. AN03gr2]|uniref:hypothetical protein n=1 Tax=Leptolyngbya sp. AN03gr2 TaxID=3423364 RepID=UPI003D3236BB
MKLTCPNLYKFVGTLDDEDETVMLFIELDKELQQVEVRLNERSVVMATRYDHEPWVYQQMLGTTLNRSELHTHMKMLDLIEGVTTNLELICEDPLFRLNGVWSMDFKLEPDSTEIQPDNREPMVLIETKGRKEYGRTID